MIKKQSFQSSCTNNSPLCTLETKQSEQPSYLWLPFSDPPTDRRIIESWHKSNWQTSRSQAASESLQSNYFQISLNNRNFLLDCSSLGEVQLEVEKILGYSGVRENIYHSLKLFILQKIVGSHKNIRPLFIKAMEQYSTYICRQIDVALQVSSKQHDD